MRGLRPIAFIALLSLGTAGVALGCAAPTTEERMADWREMAVSPERWETVRPYLEKLQPGDDLGLFIGAREVHDRKRPKQPPVVVIPSWISSMSGGAAGGLSMFGQFVGRSGERVHGSHVFGVVESDRIEPHYQVVTEATLIPFEEYGRLAAGATKGIGVIPRPAGALFFRDLYVVGRRALDLGVGDATDADEAVRSKQQYTPVMQVLDALPPGTDLLSMLAALDATFLTGDFGESHSLRAPGFLHAGQVRTRTIEEPGGLYKLRPFGWLDGETEVVAQIAIFENDRLLNVVAHRGLDDWQGYLAEELARAIP